MSDDTILTERLRGRTLRDLADTNNMTAEGIRLVVVRAGRKQIDRIELDLVKATKTDEVVAFVVPDHGGEDFDLALSYVQWVVAELTERGVLEAARDLCGRLAAFAVGRLDEASSPAEVRAALSSLISEVRLGFEDGELVVAASLRVVEQEPQPLV